MKVSMVINTYNRGSLLDKNFQKLKQLTVPDEIIVVDDGGNDKTDRVCDKYSDLPIRYIYNKNPGVTLCSLARNIGVKQASYDWIVTCEPELIYITDIISQFKERRKYQHKHVITAGDIFLAPNHSKSPEEDYENFHRSGDYDPIKNIGWVAPYTALWKKSWIQEVGGWDEEFPGNWGWDDIDILNRMRVLLGVENYIATECTAIHQYHGGSLGDKAFVNEKYWRSKFTEVGGKGREYEKLLEKDCVANRGKLWGTILN